MNQEEKMKGINMKRSEMVDGLPDPEDKKNYN